MDKTFSRNPAPGIMLIVAGGIFLFTSFLRFSMNDSLGFLTLFASALLIVNAIWMLSSPYIKIGSGEIKYNLALLNRRTISVSDLRRIERNGNKLDVFLGNGSRVRIRLNGMPAAQRDTFVDVLEQLTDANKGDA